MQFKLDQYEANLIQHVSFFIYCDVGNCCVKMLASRDASNSSDIN
jgi:hypothetical protein